MCVKRHYVFSFILGSTANRSQSAISHRGQRAGSECEKSLWELYTAETKMLGLKHQLSFHINRWASIFQQVSPFWNLSLHSSPCSLYEVLLSLHNKNKRFYHPLGLFAFSQQYFFFLLQNILFKGVFNESFLIQIDWQTRWHKRAPFLVPKLEKIKIKKEKIQNS